MPSRGATGSAAGDSIVLQEEIDPNYEPTHDEILEYAKWLGMNLEVDQNLLWIAKEGLKAPLPAEWKPCKTTDTEEIYYFNFSTGQSTWDHPCDDYYRTLYEEQKRKDNVGSFGPRQDKPDHDIAMKDIKDIIEKTTERSSSDMPQLETPRPLGFAPLPGIAKAADKTMMKHPNGTTHGQSILRTPLPQRNNSGRGGQSTEHDTSRLGKPLRWQGSHQGVEDHSERDWRNPSSNPDDDPIRGPRHAHDTNSHFTTSDRNVSNQHPESKLQNSNGQQEYHENSDLMFKEKQIQNKKLEEMRRTFQQQLEDMRADYEHEFRMKSDEATRRLRTAKSESEQEFHDEMLHLKQQHKVEYRNVVEKHEEELDLLRRDFDTKERLEKESLLSRLENELEELRHDHEHEKQKLLEKQSSESKRREQLEDQGAVTERELQDLQNQTEREKDVLNALREKLQVAEESLAAVIEKKQLAAKDIAESEESGDGNQHQIESLNRQLELKADVIEDLRRELKSKQQEIDSMLTDVPRKSAFTAMRDVGCSVGIQEDEISEMHQQVKRLQDELSNRTEMLSAANDTIDSVELKCEKSQREVTQLRTKFESSDKERFKLKQDLKVLQGNFEEVQLSERALRSRKIDLAADLDESNRKLANAENQLTKLQKKLENTEQQVSSLVAEREELLDSGAAISPKSSDQQANDSSTDDKSMIVDQVALVEARYHKLQIRYSKLENQITESNLEYERVVNDLQIAEDTKADLNIRFMAQKRQLDDFEQQLKDKQTHIETLRNQVDSANADARKYKELVQVQEKDLRNLNKRKNEIEAQLAELGNLNSKLDSDLKLSKAHCAAVERELQREQDQTQDMRKLINELELEKGKVEVASSQRLESVTLDHTKQLEQLELEKQQVEQLKLEKQQVEQKLERVTNSKRLAEETIQQLQARIDNQSSELNELRAELSEANLKHNNEHDGFENDSSLVHELQRRVKFLETQLTKRQTQLDENQQKFREFENRVDELREASDQLQYQLSATKRELDTKETEIKLVKKRNEQLEKDSDALNQSRKDLMQEKFQVEQKLSDATRKFRENCEELLQANAKISSIESKLSVALQSRDQVMAKLADLEQRHESDQNDTVLERERNAAAQLRVDIEALRKSKQQQLVALQTKVDELTHALEATEKDKELHLNTVLALQNEIQRLNDDEERHLGETQTSITDESAKQPYANGYRSTDIQSLASNNGQSDSKVQADTQATKRQSSSNAGTNQNSQENQYRDSEGAGSGGGNNPSRPGPKDLQSSCKVDENVTTHNSKSPGSASSSCSELFSSEDSASSLQDGQGRIILKSIKRLIAKGDRFRDRAKIEKVLCKDAAKHVTASKRALVHREELIVKLRNFVSQVRSSESRNTNSSSPEYSDDLSDSDEIHARKQRSNARRSNDSHVVRAMTEMLAKVIQEYQGEQRHIMEHEARLSKRYKNAQQLLQTSDEILSYRSRASESMESFGSDESIEYNEKENVRLLRSRERILQQLCSKASSILRQLDADPLLSNNTSSNSANQQTSSNRTSSRFTDRTFDQLPFVAQQPHYPPYFPGHYGTQSMHSTDPRYPFMYIPWSNPPGGFVNPFEASLGSNGLRAPLQSVPVVPQDPSSYWADDLGMYGINPLGGPVQSTSQANSFVDGIPSRIGNPHAQISEEMKKALFPKSHTLSDARSVAAMYEQVSMDHSRAASAVASHNRWLMGFRDEMRTYCREKENVRRNNTDSITLANRMMMVGSSKFTGDMLPGAPFVSVHQPAGVLRGSTNLLRSKVESLYSSRKAAAASTFGADIEFVGESALDEEQFGTASDATEENTRNERSMEFADLGETQKSTP